MKHALPQTEADTCMGVLSYLGWRIKQNSNKAEKYAST